MTGYRRRAPALGETAAALVTSVALGAGVAAVAFWVMRVLLSREPGPGADTGGGSAEISGAGRPPKALPIGGRVRGG